MNHEPVYELGRRYKTTKKIEFDSSCNHPNKEKLKSLDNACYLIQGSRADDLYELWRKRSCNFLDLVLFEVFLTSSTKPHSSEQHIKSIYQFDLQRIFIKITKHKNKTNIMLNSLEFMILSEKIYLSKSTRISSLSMSMTNVQQNARNLVVYHVYERIKEINSKCSENLTKTQHVATGGWLADRCVGLCPQYGFSSNLISLNTKNVSQNFRPYSICYKTKLFWEFHINFATEQISNRM
uniref:Uncharacterized protein n=1 Tax=Glossina brevipalpis TaxID=37001 RepID=A0A1A9X2A2_9MUSC